MWQKKEEVSRRWILEQNPTSLEQGCTPERAQEQREQVPCCCDPADVAAKGKMLDFPHSESVARRRNSTYLALACANAASQGSMTRKFREMFENPPVKETLPPLSKAEIQQSIQAQRLRRNSFQPEAKDQCSAALIVSKEETIAAPSDHHSVQLVQSIQPARSIQSANSGQPVQPASPVQRCLKCSTILSNPALPEPAVKPVTAPPVPALDQTNPPQDTADENQTIVNVPTNREVVVEELPKRDTVKNARSLFESTSGSRADSYATLRPANRMSEVKSNPSSKILRSESTQSLHSLSLGRSMSSTTDKFRRPKFSLPAEDSVADEKTYVKAVGRLTTAALRWPSRAEQVHRTPSPSPTSPPPQRDGSYGHPQFHPHYRSTPSLYRTNRSSLHSADVESVVSEVSCDWSSDLQSASSFSSYPGRTSDPTFPSGRNDRELHGRYIPPEVLQKIRSYGMTLTFVNGRMVDEDGDEDQQDVDDDDDDDVSSIRDVRLLHHQRVAETKTTNKTIRSAGNFPIRFI